MSHAVARLLRRVLFAWLACAGHAAQALPEQVVHIAQTEFVKSDAADPPQAGWQPQSLPDSWRKLFAHRRAAGEVEDWARRMQGTD